MCSLLSRSATTLAPGLRRPFRLEWSRLVDKSFGVPLCVMSFHINIISKILAMQSGREMELRDRDGHTGDDGPTTMTTLIEGESNMCQASVPAGHV